MNARSDLYAELASIGFRLLALDKVARAAYQEHQPLSELVCGIDQRGAILCDVEADLGDLARRAARLERSELALRADLAALRRRALGRAIRGEAPDPVLETEILAVEAELEGLIR